MKWINCNQPGYICQTGTIKCHYNDSAGLAIAAVLMPAGGYVDRFMFVLRHEITRRPKSEYDGENDDNGEGNDNDNYNDRAWCVVAEI